MTSTFELDLHRVKMDQTPNM